MHLSRLILSLESVQVRRDLGNPREMHRTIMAVFPQTESDQPRKEFSVLWRVDQDSAGRSTVLYVQSSAEPDWSRLPDGYLRVTDAENPAVKSVGHIYSGLKNGQVLSFRLRANAATRRDDTSNRIGVLGEENQLAWLADKGARNGFEIVGTHALAERPVLTRPDATPIHLHSVLFDGYLRITDGDLFQNVLREGIGPAKTYGFGLLSLAPRRVS